MSDKFNLEMTIPQLIEYVKRCPKQFAGELPDKVEKFINAKMLQYEQVNKDLEILLPETEEAKQRREVATQIMIKHAPHSAMNMELLADYCVEGADELLKRLKR